MDDWFDTLANNRRQWVDATYANNFQGGIWRMSADKYADATHFVYELLQSAEDQEAKTATFSLFYNYLIFQHDGYRKSQPDGKPFTRQDVESITGLGNSEKPQQPNKIGKFGIGFKSVFVITDRPEIYTTLDEAAFSFAIEDLVVPVRLPPDSALKKGETRFILPFQKGRTEELYEAISDKLQSLGADTLLFLHHLTDISWNTETHEGYYFRESSSRRDGSISLWSEAGPKNKKKNEELLTYWLHSKTFSHQDEGQALTVSMAFLMEDNKIIPEQGLSVLNVYFPTQENTGLRFRLHGPFMLTDNRANLKRGEAANSAIMAECASLLAETLPLLRDKGLLTTQLLNCLPISEDEFRSGSAFRPLYDTVRAVLKASPLLPTEDGRFADANHAKLARTPGLRPLLAGEPLRRLFGSKETVCWLPEDITQDRNEDLWKYLRDALGIDVVDADAFAARVDAEFLAAQSDDWMIDFYGFLLGQEAL